MHTIHKCTFQVTDRVLIPLPYGSTILSVGTQNDQDLTVWYLCKSDSPNVEYFLRVYGTGHRVDHAAEGSRFLGTVKTHKGELVWHVFEVGYGLPQQAS